MEDRDLHIIRPPLPIKRGAFYRKSTTLHMKSSSFHRKRPILDRWSRPAEALSPSFHMKVETNHMSCESPAPRAALWAYAFSQHSYDEGCRIGRAVELEG